MNYWFFTLFGVKIKGKQSMDCDWVGNTLLITQLLLVFLSIFVNIFH